MSTSFKQLIEKVQQAEAALEAQERRVAADWRQLRSSWTSGWTPGRIVLAGLVSGFVIGRVEPLRAGAKGSTIMQMINAVSGLLATAKAKEAASEVEHVAQQVEAGAPATRVDAVPPVDAV